MGRTRLRWKLAEEDEEPGGQGALFATEDLVDRHVGTGEYRGLEFLHVNARRIINEVPVASRLPFRWTINAYRGCSHACEYCTVGDTPVLMADGRTKPIAELHVGDEIYGTARDGKYRRFVRTQVLAHWRTVKDAYRVTLEDGTEIVCSGDHRFLTGRGWKYVTGTQQGGNRRPHLTLDNELLGTGAFARAPHDTADYRAGYLCGLIRGYGHIGHRPYRPRGGGESARHKVRLGLADLEPLHRARRYLADLAIPTGELSFQQAVGATPETPAIRAQSWPLGAAVEGVIEWPSATSGDWAKGFLAGFFDAEGSYSRGTLRMFNTDQALIDRVTESLRRFGFRFAIDAERGTNGPVAVVRVVGGLQEHLRFFHTTDPATTRKRTIEGQAVKSNAKLRVAGIERLGLELPMFDITTGTGDFIANGVVSHNCFARPTHEYLGLNTGSDFDSKIVVKVNAVERLRAELAGRRWAGDHIAMGTNTDPYQRCEGKYRLTRGIVGVLSDAANPFSILTKSTLVLRDLDLLGEAAKRTSVRVNFSIGTLDEDVWRSTEPGTPHPRRRVEAVRRLNEAGVACGVLVAPVLPGLSDRPEQLEEVVSACVDAGAVSISAIPLHLRPGVREHFMTWLQAERPDLVPEYEERYKRAYLPKADQRELSGTVARVVAEARGHFQSPRDSRLVRPDASPLDSHPLPPSEQDGASPDASVERAPTQQGDV